ncbi:MAG: TIM barrel protein [Clostridiales Family XIII bacterium]|jgi:L-rhamnose isomerase/sugar isomerase|nr:TIM barrel protein [Clostridiales Family XIII bacterium]
MDRTKEQARRLADSLASRGVSFDDAVESLTKLQIEMPSWAVGDSGTRYGTFRERGSARTIWDKIDDVAEIQRVCGICGAMAMHIAWDKTDDGQYLPVKRYANERGLALGTMHPDGFTKQEYIYGSIATPIGAVREASILHYKECVRVARELGIKAIGMWVPDGTNYAGQDDLRARKHRLTDGMRALYDALDDDMQLFLEYKPFEPYFYSTDVFDWGMSLLTCTKLGPRAKVLVDLGHHLSGVNIEQIVAVLMDEDRLGAFHFNNRKYADDDLIVGSVNPFELFLILNEIVAGQAAGLSPGVTYMLDQSHNIEPSIEGILFSVMNVHAAYAKALAVDRAALAEAQGNLDVVGAHRILKDAFETDIAPLLAAAREQMGLPGADPLSAYRDGGYAQKIADERNFGGMGTLGG